MIVNGPTSLSRLSVGESPFLSPLRILTLQQADESLRVGGGEANV